MNNVYFSSWFYAPPVFLLISLPFTHTVALRLTSLFVFILVVVFTQKLYKPHCTNILIFWLFLSLFSLFTAVDFYYSLGEIKTEIIYGLICFLAFSFFTKERNKLNVFLYTITISVLVACCWSIVSYFFHGKWVDNAIFGGVGGLSTVIITTLPIIFYSSYLVLKNSNHTLMLVLLFIMAFLSILYAGYLTQNIMLWPSFAMQIIVLFFLLPIQYEKTMLIAFVGLLVLALIYGMYVVGNQKGRMSDFSVASITQMLSKDPRVPAWKNVIEKISESPLRGKGFGRETLRKAYSDTTDKLTFWHSHNIFLDAGIQMGVPGILVLIGIFTCLGWFFYRLRRFGDTELMVISAIGIAVIAGVVMKNMSDSFFNRHWALLFWAQMGMLIGYTSLRLEVYQTQK